MKLYDKPPLTIDQQVDLLISRGMNIKDRLQAIRYLTHINYYRLRAYWLIFEGPANANGHTFKKGTNFEDVLALYIFDRKFRLLVLEAIERTEVSFRTRFAYIIANRYGSHAYLDQKLFKSTNVYTECMDSFKEEFNRSRETFIEHYKNTYDNPSLPPIWAACELMSFGQLSKWFKNLKNRSDAQSIAAIFNMDQSVLSSFIHHLTHVRNLTAHHARLWNRRLTITMTIPSRPSEIVDYFNFKESRNIYNTLVMLGYILKRMSPGTTWFERVRHLIEANQIVDPMFMGFPPNWEKMQIWNGKV